jgi:hypothetical protein
MGTRAWMVLIGLGLTAMPGALSANPAFDPVLNVSDTAGNSRQPHIAIDQAGTLHLVYADDTGTPLIFRILYRRSFDQGRTFTSPAAISVGPGGALRPRLAVLGGAVYVIWHEDIAPGNKEIMFRRSLDGGATFEPQVNVSQSIGLSQEGRIAVGPTGTIYVVWDEATVTGGITLARSLDGGATFETPRLLFPVIMTRDCSPGQPTGVCTPYPGVAVDAATGNVYVTWHDGPMTQFQVRFSRSTDGGTSFGAPLTLSSGLFHSHCASITVGPSGRVLVAYEYRKQDTPHRHDAMYTQSVDGGQTFSPPLNLSQGPAEAFSDYPWPAEAPDGRIVVGWEDNTAGGALDAVLALSTDGGSSFAGFQNLSDNASTTSTEVVTLFGPEGTLYVVWEDYQEGQGEIFLRIARSAVALALDANRSVVSAGDPLVLSASAENPGFPRAIDVYLGVLPPPALGPMLGCPGGDAVVFFLLPAGARTACISALPQGMVPLVSGAVLPGALPLTTFPGILSVAWPGDAPSGSYAFFLALVSQGALLDGRLDPGDVIIVATRTVVATP